MKKEKILCIHCGHRIYQTGSRDSEVRFYDVPVGTWIHYPMKFGDSKFFSCSDSGGSLATPPAKETT